MFGGQFGLTTRCFGHGVASLLIAGGPLPFCGRMGGVTKGVKSARDRNIRVALGAIGVIAGSFR